MRKKIKIGLDFDGVLAYNPFRIARPIIAIIKKYLFGVKKLKFWYPEKHWQQVFWIICHESSVFPAKGVDLLKNLVKNENIEAHLITARYSFLDNHLFNWLKKYRLTHLFKTITLNKKDEQPHIFKEKVIEKYGLDFFIEDNLDIVLHLEKNTRTKIYWIYNIFDKRHTYPYKYPYLGKALVDIVQSAKIKVQNLVKN